MSSQEPADFEALDKLILEQLTDKERARSAVYLDQDPRPAGLTLVGGGEVKVDHPHLVAFIDQRPGANWMHPCRYLLIDAVTRQCSSMDSWQPPLFGVLPPTWRAVWRSPGIADWQMLPLSYPAPQGIPIEKKEKA